jgi:hypothetical protein
MLVLRTAAAKLLYTARGMQEIQREWLRRVEAEYSSAAITHHLTLWLLQITAPFELVRLGLSIVDDELVHAELSQAVYVSAGGSSAARLERERLGLQLAAGEALELAITRVGLEVFCLGETVAVRLFSRLRQGCEEPVALEALDRILKDEVRHRDFGWTLLEWLLSTEHAEQILAFARAELPRMFTRLRTNYAFAQLGAPSAPDARAQRWGLMPPAAYADALRECLERDYVPRFRDHGIDARAAWDELLK